MSSGCFDSGVHTAQMAVYISTKQFFGSCSHADFFPKEAMRVMNSPKLKLLICTTDNYCNVMSKKKKSNALSHCVRPLIYRH